MVSSDRDRAIVRTVVVAAAAGAVGGAVLYANSRRRRLRVPKSGPFPTDSLPADAFDAIIVGGGPSGSTCGYYLAKAGAKLPANGSSSKDQTGTIAGTYRMASLHVSAPGASQAVILDKEHFPRDKYCGDAVCTPALRILEDMGVMDVLRDANECHYADAGGFVSPSGLSYIGASVEKIGEAAACAVKRLHLDHRMVQAATRVGVTLKEGFEVHGDRVAFDAQSGLWTVTSAEGEAVRGRILLCADGATSRLASHMGYCTEPPRGVCSRAFVEGGTHNTDFDGVCFYQRESLPGYSAIFKHPNEELNFCYYLIPCGSGEGQCGGVKESDLARLHNDAIKSDPFISAALGPNAKIERMKAASLRLGSQGLKTSFDDHLLIIGDAAGHIDPLTGEGIHTAIMGGKAAAETIMDMRATGDYSKQSTKEYERRWIQAFGHDFHMSKKGAELIWKHPILLDACANEMQRKGDAMMSKWAEVMTNMRPKTYFLRPDVALPLGFAVVRELWNQKVLGRPSMYVKQP